MAEQQNLHSRPYGSRTIASAIAAQPSLHPAAAVLSALAGPKLPAPTADALRARLKSDMRCLGVTEADQIGRLMVEDFGRQIRGAERRAAREAEASPAHRVAA